MVDLLTLPANAEVIGADGVHVGTLDRVDGSRLKLTDDESDGGRNRYVDVGLIAGLEGGRIRLSANGDVAMLMAENDPDEAADRRLEHALEETFPASDPVSAKHIT